MAYIGIIDHCDVIRQTVFMLLCVLVIMHVSVCTLVSVFVCVCMDLFSSLTHLLDIPKPRSLLVCLD